MHHDGCTTLAPALVVPRRSHKGSGVQDEICGEPNELTLHIMADFGSLALVLVASMPVLVVVCLWCLCDWGRRCRTRASRWQWRRTQCSFKAVCVAESATLNHTVDAADAAGGRRGGGGAGRDVGAHDAAHHAAARQQPRHHLRRCAAVSYDVHILIRRPPVPSTLPSTALPGACCGPVSLEPDKCSGARNPAQQGK